MCHVGVGWGGSCRGGVGHIQSNMVIEANHHYLYTSPPCQLLGITGGAKFNYNYTLNYWELLGEQKFNYNHTPKCQIKTITICTLYHLGITQGAKFNYNHRPNYLELLREQNSITTRHLSVSN